jgi:antitoxin component YwqK of YwqJK toxin-antitoxin module
MVPENQAVDLVNKLEISNGMVVYFFNEGSIVKSFGKYVNGKKTGVWTYYTPEGYLDQIDEIIWEGEKTQRINTKNYSIYGLLKSQKTSVNGVDVGLYKEYDENGVLIKEFELSNKGEIVGEIKLYHNTGNLNQKFSIVNNKFSDGVFSTYDKFGYLDFVQSYKNDQKEGVYKEYYRNGQLFATGTYIKGEKVGKWTSYHFLLCRGKSQFLAKRKIKF